MYYKLYKERSSSSLPAGLDAFDDFNQIYQEQGVKVIGVWQNKDDSKEYYFMMAYENEEHYLDFVENMKTNETYQQMSRELEEGRESIEVITLVDAV